MGGASDATQVLSSGANEALLSPQALHPGHGLSETVLPRQHLQTYQRVSSVPLTFTTSSFHN